MEVDDAAAVADEPLSENTVESNDVTHEKNGGQKTATGRLKGRQSLKAIKLSEEKEFPYGKEPPVSESNDSDFDSECVTDIRNKKMSSVDVKDEEERSKFSGVKKRFNKIVKSRWDVKSSTRQQFLNSPARNSKIVAGDTDAKKRPCFSLRRSGSVEYLLGFDEKTGEPELLLHDPDDDSSVVADPASPKSMSPQPKKKMKMSSSEPTSPQNSPHLKASPVNSLLQSPPLTTEDMEAVIKDDDEQSLKEHIVADNDDLELSPARSTETAARIHGLPREIPTSTKPLSIKDEYYRKPFEYGWKRELVYRANMETSKEKADVYFISPGGKKLRNRSDIIPLLEGELTIDHFCFVREPLDAAPELETVRYAKPSHRATVAAITLAAATSPPTHPGKRISKPKVPKGASPPPQGWTPTRALKTNNAALLSSAGSSKYSGSNSSTPPSSRTQSGSTNKNKTKKPIQGSAAIEAENATTNRAAAAIHEPCSMMCAQARGQVPQLQCVKCLCLFHHECVGLNRQNCEYRTVGDAPAAATAKEYVCESCVPSLTATVATTPSRTSTTASIAVSQNIIKAPTPLPSPSPVAVKKATAVRQAATVVEPAASPQRVNKLPQTIAVVKGKKYIMVSKPKAGTRTTQAAVSAEHLNDIENDLKQINDSIRQSRKTSSTSLEGAFQPITAGAEVVQKSFATNFFANVSFAYDALLCILKYLKIHERPRAASVCKLWHLAAKDTSLWQTVRMKNSKISNWAGFAAALRRGETKHLDLRKMLFSNTKGDEMWADFSSHIGTVFSLESIDLCRCSARVVEGLLVSNPQLRVLNALAINDDSYSLENVDKLTELKELRVRTCKPGTLEGDLMPLKTLTNLVHLSLTSLLGLGTKTVEVLAELVNLSSLELGECGDFDSTFAHAVLPKLAKLQRLRLENGTKTTCCTLEILDAVAKLEQLTQLEFVNFDIKPGFDDKLMLCTNIRKLLIIPTYISQSATTNQIVLYAVQQIADTLKVFTWGVTVELLRVTALYVDQCEESTKKEKHHFDECIPVMKPVPGAPASDVQAEDNDDVGPNAVPQIEILPLDKVESILAENLTTTKFTIVKMPYQATCKQQLVE